MLEEGTPPPSIAAIQRVCNRTSHTEGYTDGRGYFSIQLGQDASAFQDASESQLNLGRAYPAGAGAGAGAGGAASGTGSGRGFGPANRLVACELRAQLGGYRSQSVSLAEHGPLDNPDIGVILLHRLEGAEPATVTASTLAAPKPARKAYQKGMSLVKNRKPEEAMTSFREAVRVDPQFASAWFELGRLQAVRGEAGEAHRSFDAAGKAEPRWPDPFLELSLLAVHDHNWAELAEVTGHVLQLNSFDYPQAFLFNAVANFNLRHIDAAEKSVRSAERLDTRHRYPQSARLLAAILAGRQDWAAAADQLRDYLVRAPHAADALPIRRELDRLERLALQASVVVQTDPK